MSYLFITETGNIVSKTSAKHVARDYYLKPDIESMVDDFNNKLTERLDDGNSRVNSYFDDKFDYILPGKDLSKNLGVNYSSGVTPTDEDCGDMIFKGRPNEEDEVIDNYLNMNLLFDVGTNNKRCGTVVNHSRRLDGIAISCSHTNPLFDTRDYEIDLTDLTQDKYIVNIIAKNMDAQVDDECHQFQLLAEIQDHRKYGTEISKEE